MASGSQKSLWFLSKSLSVILTSLALSNSMPLVATATTIMGMDIDQVTNGSELIFEGEVILRKILRASDSGTINTYVTFSIFDVVKGDYEGNTIELKFAGGSIGNESVNVNGLRIPEEGEQGLYFVESITRDLINPLIGWSQGHFIIQEENGLRGVYTLDARAVIDIQSVSSIPLAIKRLSTTIKSDSDVAAGVSVGKSRTNIAEEKPLLIDELKHRILEMIK